MRSVNRRTPDRPPMLRVWVQGVYRRDDAPPRDPLPYRPPPTDDDDDAPLSSLSSWSSLPQGGMNTYTSQGRTFGRTYGKGGRGGGGRGGRGGGCGGGGVGVGWDEQSGSVGYWQENAGHLLRLARQLGTV